MPEKLCVFCDHWRFSGGSPGYSELTPGTDASMDCAKGHYPGWSTLQDLSGPEQFREVISMAQTCSDYSPPKSVNAGRSG